MTRDEIFNGVQDIFRDIFDENDKVIENKTSADDVEDWMDSITAADIDAMGGVKDFDAKEAAKMINDGVIRLISAGDGRYKVRTYGGRYFSKADGSDFNLTYGVKGQQK